MIKYSEWKDYLYEQVNNGSIYLWGGQGEKLDKLTDDYIRRKETSTSNAKRVQTLRDKRKVKYPGLRAYDCSGLAIFKLLQNGEVSSDMTSNTIYKKCKTISRSDLQPGDFVFRKDSSGHVYHIGYVVDDLKIVHAKGRDVGVVIETLNQNGASWWNAYGRSEWIEPVKPEYRFIFTKNLKKGMKGTDVKNLQALLIDNGYNCGSIDGEFGKNTLNAVKKCQKAHALQVDGIAGRNTIKALGGVFGE